MNCPECNIHIDNHSASRCLDAWVAKLMPATKYLERLYLGWLKSKRVKDWHPSIEISDAWEVVIEAFNNELELFWQNEHHLWAAMLGDKGFEARWGVGDTAPLAICRAAIMAKLK